MDLDLRKVRYFVAVADRLHLGRAADELHIAQPALSRQIRALEKDLGTPLLTRDSHGVALTDAGRQLLTDAGPLLASTHAVRRRVTVAARGSRRIMVGFRAGIAVAPAIQSNPLDRRCGASVNTRVSRAKAASSSCKAMIPTARRIALRSQRKPNMSSRTPTANCRA